MAECAVAAAARLRACQAAEDAAGLLEGGLLGMLRQGCCGEALAVACSEALLRWADAPAVAQLLLGLGGLGGDGDKEEDALRVKDVCQWRGSYEIGPVATCTSDTRSQFPKASSGQLATPGDTGGSCAWGPVWTIAGRVEERPRAAAGELPNGPHRHGHGRVYCQSVALEEEPDAG